MELARFKELEILDLDSRQATLIELLKAALRNSENLLV